MWSGPLLLAAMLSFGAGVAKLISRTGASEALRAVGIPASTTLVAWPAASATASLPAVLTHQPMAGVPFV